jgi:hypothetical protein
MTPQARAYLAGLVRAAAECIEQPRLLPVFLGVLRLAPATLRELALFR